MRPGVGPGPRFHGAHRGEHRDRGAVARAGSGRGDTRAGGPHGGRPGVLRAGSRRLRGGRAVLAPAAEIEASRRTREEQREHERAQVAAHYEHSPDVFSLVLDGALTYSTGVYLDAGEDLETAQQRKFAYVRRLLDIQPGEAVLDVGCGWGSNLLSLAAHTEGHFHGITLSGRQRDELLRRARERGFESRVRVDVCHVEDLALAPASVDAVLFSGSIVHMRN